MQETPPPANTGRIPIALIGISLYGDDAQILKGIHRYSRLKGNWIVETASHDVRDFSFKNLYRLPRGLIGHINHQDLAEYVTSSGIPVVNISGAMPSRLPFPFVGIEQQHLGRVAAEHLLDLGLRNLAISTSPDSVNEEFMKQRIQGFLNRLRGESHIRLFCLKDHANVSDSMLGKPGSLPALTEIQDLKHIPKPCGVFAPSDRIGLIINEKCLQFGINVPEEVSIIGAGNLEILCEFSHPGLSSIASPMEQVGFEAARTLHQILEEKQVAERTLISGPMRVIPRQSTSQIIVEDPLVREALTYIRDNLRNGINVADVAQHCKGTRRNLEIRFRKETGNSILDRIHLMRIRIASELLSSSSEPMSAIAPAVGYSNTEHMSRSFKRYLGKSPSEFKTEFYGNPPSEDGA